MIRIVLAAMFAVGVTVALMDLIPDGMWVQLGLLAGASFGFGMLFTLSIIMKD